MAVSATLARVVGPAAAVFSCLLILTGLAKLRRPGDTSRAIAALGLPNHRATGFMIGVAEIGVGVTALMTGGTVSLLAQGALYALFALWIVIALARDLPIASCGCLGTDDTPPYWGHLILDIAAAGLSLTAAFTLSTPVFAGSTLEVVATALLIGIGAFLSWLVIGPAARLRGAYSA